MAESPTSSRQPHRLTLYRRAVQHPEAEVAFFLKAWRHRRGRAAPPTLLKEDFAGTAAVAAAWVALHPDHQALAVESHAPTLRWAERNTRAGLGVRADDLHLVHADVMQCRSPRVDIVAALNFSVFTWHEPDTLLAYFRNARRSLRPGGILVMDAYGGSGAMRVGVQHRTVPAGETTPPFQYTWEQRAFDPIRGRADCRIHFNVAGRAIRHAFRYDWRLWSLPELVEGMIRSGFGQATVWCDRVHPTTGVSDGIYRPARTMPAREDWVAYVVGHV